MKQSKLLKTIFLFLGVVIISCTSEDTPRSIGEKFLKAMSVEDFETAKKYVTQETEKLLDMMSGFTKMSVDSVKKEMKFEITRETINGDNAVIHYKEEGRTGEMELPMIKIDGKWKVLLSKESINNSEGANSMEIGAMNTDTAK